MGKGQRGGDFTQQAHARVDIAAGFEAVQRDRRAVHILHRVKRLSARQFAAVVQRRDIRMHQPGQDAALALETLMRRCADARLHDLERHLLRELAVRAFGQVHHAHAADAEQARDPVRAEMPAQRILGIAGQCALQQRRRDIRSGFV
jgi:hypothetical protein